MIKAKRKISGKQLAVIFGLLVLGGASSSAVAAGDHHPHSQGAGVILGEPSGLTGKFWQQSDRAIDAGVAFSFNHFVFFYADYLFHFKPIETVIPYIGVGGGLLVASSGKVFDTKESGVGLGLRIPLGAEWFIPRSPFGVFAELVPGMGLVPSTVALFQGGIGIRFYFK